MATLYVSEYASAGVGPRGVQVAAEPAIADQSFSFTGTSAQSAAFSAQTKFVRIHTDAICSILFGANPTAVTSKKRLDAGQTEYFAVTPGHIVAAITNT